jgi:peptidoglycan glycosyltransferase
MRKNIIKIGLLLLGSFCFLILYLSYIQIIKGPDLEASEHNKRILAYEKLIHRGRILDCNGDVLAYSEDNSNKRIYTKGGELSPVLGFISERYGRTGIEAAGDRYLLGITPDSRFDKFISRMSGEKSNGYDLTLTIDANIQSLAMKLLAQRKGAVVVLNPGNGEVLALASTPTFDPNQVDETWSQLTTDPDSALLNRATQGAYPPGSVFKLVTEAAALTNNPQVANEVFTCPGYLDVQGFRLKDNSVHGQLQLSKALAVSCNTTFAQLGLSLGAEKFTKAAEGFGFGQKPPLEVPVRASTLAPVDKLTGTQLATTAIGQGDVLASPLQMALVAAAVANQGVIMQPHLFSEVKDSAGNIIYKHQPKVWLNAASSQVTEEIKKGMEMAVVAGTAGKASVQGFQVAGKTGSAENPNGKAHAWFIGFAPSEHPRYVVAVIVENAGAGGAVSAPVAKEIFSALL